MIIKTKFLSVVSLLLASAFDGTARAEAIKVPFSSISWFQAPFVLSRDSGVLEKNNLGVEFIFIPVGSLLVQVLLSGNASE